MTNKNKIAAISYDLSGCIFSHACANTVIKLASGKTIKDAGSIQSQDIVSYLKTLPKAEIHCAGHALGAFKKALSAIDAAP